MSAGSPAPFARRGFFFLSMPTDNFINGFIRFREQIRMILKCYGHLGFSLPGMLANAHYACIFSFEDFLFLLQRCFDFWALNARLDFFQLRIQFGDFQFMDLGVLRVLASCSLVLQKRRYVQIDADCIVCFQFIFGEENQLSAFIVVALVSSRFSATVFATVDKRILVNVAIVLLTKSTDPGCVARNVFQAVWTAESNRPLVQNEKEKIEQDGNDSRIRKPRPREQ